jgi:methionyl aminopeptidase
MIICKSASEIELMKKAGEIVAEILLKIEQVIEPGITTGYLNKVAEKMMASKNVIAAFKGYKSSISKKPYPSSICVSVNEEVVHGIPGSRILKDGDLVSVDVGVKLKHFYGDAARSFKVGSTSKVVDKLFEATYSALNLGISKCVGGNRLSDVSNQIEKRAIADGFSVVKDFVGHGIGRSMHEDPQILNYGPPGHGPVLKRGMALAIEPMLTEGTGNVEILDDMWTVVTGDKKLSCHFEDTVAITENGPLILTRI